MTREGIFTKNILQPTNARSHWRNLKFQDHLRMRRTSCSIKARVKAFCVTMQQELIRILPSDSFLEHKQTLGHEGTPSIRGALKKNTALFGSFSQHRGRSAGRFSASGPDFDHF